MAFFFVFAVLLNDSNSSFDVLGDTVNVAARMESMSKPNCILVTDAFRRELEPKNLFEFVDNGVRDVKGKGPMRTWFLMGLKKMEL